MTETNRQQTVVERILEDESLRGELEDPAATALINWASERAGTIAADPSRSDAEVDAAAQAIRSAARQAASSGEQEPERVVALAEAALAEQSPNQANATAESPPQSPDSSTTVESPSDDADTEPSIGASDQNDAATLVTPAEPAVGATTKAPVSKRRSKRRARSRRKSK